MVVVLPDGSPGTVPMAVTDVLGDEPLPDGPSTVLSVEGVRQFRALVDSLKPARRSPSRSKTRK
ncbi:MAG: hypothetical protein ACRD0I_01185 [Acidimicrobiales bacterium]